jgi:hypothetical protein
MNFSVENVSMENTVNNVNYDHVYNFVNNNGLNEDNYSISIGIEAGLQNQSSQAISIGSNAGEFNQGYCAIAIGNSSGNYNQGPFTVSLGSQVSDIYDEQQIEQKIGAVSIGAGAGTFSQGEYAISIGYLSGGVNQQFGSIAIGASTGQFDQGAGSICIGFTNSLYNQGLNSISIGSNTSTYYTGPVSDVISIGSSVSALQSPGAIFLGSAVGGSYTATQGYSAINIGSGVGDFEQNDYSIILNAYETNFSVADEGLYINPIREYSNLGVTNPIMYDNVTKEVFVNTNKTFVIDHPLDESKYLVHACVESPSSNLFYNGIGKIGKGNKSVDIQLPNYVEKIGRNFTVSLTCKGKNGNLYTDGVIDGKYFTVFGEEDSEFFWHVYGLMGTIIAEPNKHEVELKGHGPYKWV